MSPPMDVNSGKHSGFVFHFEGRSGVVRLQNAKQSPKPSISTRYILDKIVFQCARTSQIAWDSSMFSVNSCYSWLPVQKKSATDPVHPPACRSAACYSGSVRISPHSPALQG